MKKISVVKEQCVACGACYGNASDVFASDSDGTSKVIKNLIEDDDTFTISVAEGCPTGAIKIEDATEKNCDCEDCDCEKCDCEECNCNHE